MWSYVILLDYRNEELDEQRKDFSFETKEFRSESNHARITSENYCSSNESPKENWERTVNYDTDLQSAGKQRVTERLDVLQRRKTNEEDTKNKERVFSGGRESHEELSKLFGWNVANQLERKTSYEQDGPIEERFLQRLSFNNETTEESRKNDRLSIEVQMFETKDSSNSQFIIKSSQKISSQVSGMTRAKIDSNTKLKKNATLSQMHQNEKPYKCLQCGKTYKRKKQLKRHQRICANKKPSESSSRDKEFTRRDVFTKHSKTLHQCCDCYRSFVLKSNLVRHLRTHTNEKPFKCSSCDKPFTRSDNLSRHLRTHTSKQSY